MIIEKKILTMEQLMEMVAEQHYRPDLGRYRDLHIFRGEPDASFTLSTSLRRNW